MTTELPPALAALMGRVELGETTEDDRATLARALRALAEGRPARALLAEATRRDRDAVLQSIRADHYPDHTISGAAKEIAKAMLRYAAGAWRIDQRETVAPYAPGSLRRGLYDALHLGQPIGWRSILESLQRSPRAAANRPAIERHQETRE